MLLQRHWKAQNKVTVAELKIKFMFKKDHSGSSGEHGSEQYKNLRQEPSWQQFIYLTKRILQFEVKKWQ